ncbi:MAG TPA: RHS repeat-associated core domain-containing protein [Planctomycetota bacterium]|nr:RHS repeat-associated core domain-containing protein [Planctomycetota bacterium]
MRPETSSRRVAKSAVARALSGTTTLAQTTFSFDEANRLYETAKLAKQANLSTDLGDGTQNLVIWRDERGAVLEHSGDVCGCNNFTHVYDAVGRQVTTSDPMADSNLVITQYDKDGNVTKTTRHEETQDSNIEADKDLVTEVVYDARHRAVSRKEQLTASPTYATTVYFYGLRDQVTKVVDPESDEVRMEHNEQLWKTKDTAENGAADVITSYTFDSDGRMVTYLATNSTTGNQATLYAYDKLDRVVTTTWPDAGTHIYSYDKAGNRISTTDPNGTLTVATYDAASQLTSETLTLASGVVGATNRTFGYDGMGRRTQADTSENAAYTTSIVWTFNTLSKPQTEKQVIDGYNSGAGRTITWDWDVEGQKTGVTYPVSGSVVTYTRDALDRADRITRDGSQVVDYAFNGRRVIQKAYPGSQALYTWDGAGRLTQVHHKDSGSGNILAKLVYAYDQSHQVTSQDKYFYDDVQNTRITTDTVDEGDQYDYDGAKRLVTTLRAVPTAYIGDSIASNLSNNRYDDFVEYLLDQTGNRLTRQIDGANNKTYAHNAVNEVTTEAGVTQDYTANGNFSGAGSVIYKYAANDQLAWFDAGVRQFTWHYDALGRQVARTKSGSGGPNDTHIYYDGLDDVEVCSWLDSTETLSRRMVYGERINELLEHTDVSADPDVIYYAHADTLDSILLLVLADGSIKESYRYSDYGEPTVLDHTFTKLGTLASNINNWKRYTGQEYALPSSVGDGWQFYRARAYRADAGRFVQRDPLGVADGANLYSYVHLDPLRLVDPSGMMCSWQFNITETKSGTAAQDADCHGIVYIGQDHRPDDTSCGAWHADIHLDTAKCESIAAPKTDTQPAMLLGDEASTFGTSFQATPTSSGPPGTASYGPPAGGFGPPSSPAVLTPTLDLKGGNKAVTAYRFGTASVPGGDTVGLSLKFCGNSGGGVGCVKVSIVATCYCP